MIVVYCATNKVNGKRYIGVTKHGLAVRKKQHLYAARANRNRCTIFVAALRKYGPESFDWSVLSTADQYEEALAEEVRLIAEMRPEYNVTRGGQGASYPKTEEHKAKTSRSLTGRKHPPEWATHVGRAVSDETRAKLQSIGRRSSRVMEFQHLGPAASSKEVICTDTKILYPSASAAARAHSVSKSMVIELCNGNPRRKTAAGMRFEYLGNWCPNPE